MVSDFFFFQRAYLPLVSLSQLSSTPITRLYNLVRSLMSALIKDIQATNGAAKRAARKKS